MLLGGSLVFGQSATPPESSPQSDMVKISGKQFIMGRRPADGFIFWDEKPWPPENPLPVEVRAFLLDRREVTNAEYQKCVEKGSCSPSGYADHPRYNKPDQPVVGVTWQQARDYCRRQNKRLPRETEWELAARVVCRPAADGDLRHYAWHADNAQGRPQPVGTRAPDLCGAYDLLGNVWEWCGEWYTVPPRNWWKDGPPPEENPILFVEGHGRVLRGGAWNTPPESVNPTLRFWRRPDRYSPTVGFRCAMNAHE